MVDLLKKPTKRKRQLPTLADLQAQIEELEATNQQFGASNIEQDKPGVFRRIVDVLSRPNFAIAGAVEEILQGRSVTSAVARSVNEILSGVGDFQGEKRAFGEVFERLGVGTKTLADAFPALENTWIGNFGSRGLAGIALDIATDPLTYMTFGAATGMRVATSKGIAYLNKAGTAARKELFNKNMALARGTLKSDDAISQTKLWNRVVKQTDDEFEALYGVEGKIRSDFLEPGGAKLFGAQIPLSDKLGVPLKGALSMLPESIVKPAVEGATAFKDGMGRAIKGIFSPEGPLANLPEPIRTRAVNLTNDFFRSTAAHRVHLLAKIDPLEQAYRKLEKLDPKIGERWHDIREGVRPLSDITNPEELRAFQETMQLYDSMGQTLLDTGVLKNDQLIGKYIYHQYKNIEDLSQYHPRPGVKVSSAGSPDILKERVWETVREGQSESKRLHELSLHMLSRGEANRLYPALEPEFDVFKNMRRYVDKHADALGRKAWREEMVAQFGKQIDELDFDALYDDIPEGLVKDTPGAPKDFTPENVPLRRVIKEGDTEETLRKAFGAEGAEYVAVKSAFTNNELVYLPRAIAETLENVNSRLVNTSDYKAFGQLLRGFDWANNNFKWGVYTLWPASAVRDGYSNIALSMLRIGLAALDPKRHIDTIRLMAGRGVDLAKEFAGTGYTIGQLKELSKTFGVWVPGSVFIEQTGKFNVGKFRKALTEKRAMIENEARVQLWLEEIRRGADPRSAADTVGQFLFNYGEVSQVERELFRRLIPFYTFTRKNVELQSRVLRQKPGLVANQLKPFRGRNDENEAMVKWQAEGLKIRLDRDGKTVHMLNGIDLPLRNLDTIWTGTARGTVRRLGGMITPLVKALPEYALGREFFTGRDSERAYSGAVGRFIEAAHTPKALKDWLGYKKDTDAAGRPSYSFDGVRFNLLFRSWMFSRLVSTSDRVFREYAGQEGWGAALLDIGTGIRVETLDMDESMRRRYARRIRQLQEAQRRRGLAYGFTRTVPRDVSNAEFQ